MCERIINSLHQMVLFTRMIRSALSPVVYVRIFMVWFSCRLFIRWGCKKGTVVLSTKFSWRHAIADLVIQTPFPQLSSLLHFSFGCFPSWWTSFEGSFFTDNVLPWACTVHWYAIFILSVKCHYLLWFPPKNTNTAKLILGPILPLFYANPL